MEAEPADEAAEDMAPEEEGGEALGRPQLLLKAGAMLAGGVALCAAFSDPLVESLTNLSRCGEAQARAMTHASCMHLYLVATQQVTWGCMRSHAEADALAWDARTQLYLTACPLAQCSELLECRRSLWASC